jgi:rubrerythrin
LKSWDKGLSQFRTQSLDVNLFLFEIYTLILLQRKELKSLLSKIPINLEKIRKEDLNKEILRAAIIAELDAVNLYEQMAALTEDKHIKTILLDIAKEEKTHVGEFQALLLLNDNQQEKELAEGKKEVEELTS